MKKTPISIQLEHFPAPLRPLLENAHIYDSSCSQTARVWFLDYEDGYFLKQAKVGELAKEAAMTRFFHSKGLGTEVLDYMQSDQDWLLTRRVPGEDCLDQQYLDNPKRLCDTTALLLRQLHEVDGSGCPVNRTDDYIRTARDNYRSGHYDASLFPDNWGYASAPQACQAMEAAIPYLKSDTLLHGDYCLPNIMLKDWDFSGFIDLECAGLGDRHMDLHWGLWSLWFNLKTDAYRDRFLDVYGRDKVEPELLEAIGAFEVFME